MIPHIAWAFAQRNLKPSERLVLIALADRANGEKVCFPSMTCLSRDCELSRRVVVEATQCLRERGLIELVTNPTERQAIFAKANARGSEQVNVYRILRDGCGADKSPTHGNGAETSPTHGNGADKSPPCGGSGAERSPTQPKARPEPVQNPHSTGAESALGPVQNLHPNPLTESFNEPKTRACAREEAITSLEEKQSCPSPEPPDERVDPARVAELVAETVRSFGGNYPPRDPKRSWSEQRDAVAPSRLRDVSFRGEQLAAIRRLGQANLGVPGHA